MEDFGGESCLEGGRFGGRFWGGGLFSGQRGFKAHNFGILSLGSFLRFFLGDFLGEVFLI